MLFKRSVLLLLVLVLSVFIVLAGCSNNDGNNGGNTSNQTDSDSSNNDEKSEPVDENFNPEGLPVVDEAITIRVAGKTHPFNKGSNWNEKLVFERLQEKTNVNVKWDLTPNAGWNEKRNLLIASGDLPDVLLNIGDAADGGSSSEIVSLGDDGVIIPLEDMIEKYAPNLKALFEKRPEMKKMITAPDGHIYTLPRSVESPTSVVKDSLWINGDWLKNVGMEMPTTTEEFKEVLMAFKEQDANGNGDASDEIPFSFLYDDNSNYGLYSIFGPFGTLDYSNKLMVRDGQAQFTAVQPEWKNGVKYLHSLYKEGLIDPEAFTQDQSQMRGKMSGETALVGACSCFSNTAAVRSDNKWQYAPIYEPLKGPDGHQMYGGHPIFFQAGAFAITVANEHPEATLRWVDQVYETWTSFDFGQGPRGHRWEDTDEGWVRKDAPEGMTNGEFRYAEAPGNDFPYVVLEETLATKVPGGPNPNAKYMDRREFIPKLTENDFIKYWYFPSIMNTPENAEELAKYKTDIINYVKKMEAQWITQGGIEEGWDDYMDQLEKLNFNEMMKIYEDAYERYSNN